MGWDGTVLDTNIRDYVDATLRRSFGEGLVDYVIIDPEPASRHFEESEVYAAVMGDDGAVRAVVMLVNCEERPEGDLWLHKFMGESEGPFYYNCPRRILDLLDEPGNEWAANWRERCGGTGDTPEMR